MVEMVFAMYLKGSDELCSHELRTIHLLEDGSVFCTSYCWAYGVECVTMLVPITPNTRISSFADWPCT